LLDSPPSATTSSAPRTDLTAARKRAKLSQAALGRKLADAAARPKAYSQTIVSQWEKGDTPLPAEVVAVLDRVLPGWQSARTPALPPPPSSRTPVSERGDLFDRWCSIAGIDPDFPTLSRFRRRDDASTTYRNQSWASTLGALSRTRSDVTPALVSLAEGHGVSTFVEVLAADLQPRSEDGVRGRLPVVVHAEQLLEAGAEERLRRRLVRRLCQLQRDDGSKELGDALGSKFSIYRVAALEPPELDALDWSHVADEGARPLLASDDLASVIRTLEADFGLTSCFIVDASSSALDRSRRLRDPRDEIMKQVLDWLNAMTDRGVFAVVVGSRTLLRAASEDHATSLGGGLPDRRIFTVPPFEPGDYFRILIQHFGRDVELRVDGALLAGLVGEERSLKRSGEVLKLRLVEASAVPGGVPLRLTAT
jgi:transcriptional regulator with XRE-family HTH domain